MSTRRAEFEWAIDRLKAEFGDQAIRVEEWGDYGRTVKVAVVKDAGHGLGFPLCGWNNEGKPVADLTPEMLTDRIDYVRRTLEW